MTHNEISRLLRVDSYSFHSQGALQVPSLYCLPVMWELPVTIKSKHCASCRSVAVKADVPLLTGGSLRQLHLESCRLINKTAKDRTGSRQSVRSFEQQTFDCQLTVEPLPARRDGCCTFETGLCSPLLVE